MHTNNTITVKGTGQASASPDDVIITLDLDSIDLNYDKAMACASQKVDKLTETVLSCGFDKDVLKTTRFDVSPHYEWVKDKYGDSKNVFKGYKVTHNLKVEFDFDTQKLSQVLSAIAGCVAKPELDIRFTVKDTGPLKEELLKSAVNNARHNAEILCEAAGVTLGVLRDIDYSWSEINVYSHTTYNMDCLAAPSVREEGIDFVPEDIDVRDTVTMVWDIKED